MSMSRGVAGLPLELLINVVSHLNLEDFINLKLASGELFQLLNNESLSREMVKVDLSLSLPLSVSQSHSPRYHVVHSKPQSDLTRS